MTQVKEMSKQTLNYELAVLMGWTEIRVLVPSERLMGRDPVDKWATYIPDYVCDPAASLEVQTAAITANKLLYFNTLLSIVNPGEDIQFGYGGNMEVAGYTVDGTAAMFTATPRERAEAAYITLSSKQ